MKKYQNIIWDWNGTLLNDIDLCLNIANKIAINHRDLPLGLAEYRNAFGFPITTYYEKIGIDLEKESFEVLTEKFAQNYYQGAINCRMHNGVNDLLINFQQKQINQFILTAAHLDMVLPLLNNFNINQYFKAVEGVDNFKAEGKVDRGIQLMETYRISYKKTVLIGDTYHDFEVATAMGIDCILVADGHQSKERLIDNTNGKVMVLDELKDLI